MFTDVKKSVFLFFSYKLQERFFRIEVKRNAIETRMEQVKNNLLLHKFMCLIPGTTNV